MMPGGHGVLEPERRADRQHPVADVGVLRIAQLDHRQVVRLDLEHRHVGLRVHPEDLGLELALVGELDVHLLGAVDHVGVGEDHTVLVHDEARALAVDRRFALRHLRHRAVEALEEVVERIVRIHLRHVGRRRDLGVPGHADVDHRGPVLLGDRAERRQGDGRRRRPRSTAAGAGFACAMPGSDKPSCEYPASAAVTMPAATSPRTSAFCFIC